MRLLTGRPLTGRHSPHGKGRGPLRGWVPSQRRTTFNYRKAYGKLRGGTLPELGGNFRLCAVDQKRPFFLTVGLLLDLLPFKGPFPLTGALTGRPPYGKPPYGEASYGRHLEATGRDFTRIGREFPLVRRRSKKAVFSYGWAVSGPLPFKGPFPLTGALTGRPPYGKAPYGEASYGEAPYELQESLREATGRDFTRIGREFPLVCRRPKKPFFLTVGLFLDLLPFKGPFPLTGALTGRPPYGKAPYGGGETLVNPCCRPVYLLRRGQKPTNPKAVAGKMV